MRDYSTYKKKPRQLDERLERRKRAFVKSLLHLGPPPWDRFHDALVFISDGELAILLETVSSLITSRG